jgi:glycosyltransferase involved in cell wall biosynthesis
MLTIKTQSISPFTISPSQKKIKILFVLGTLWGENGITSHLNTLSLGLMRHGFEIAITSNLASLSPAAFDQAMNAVENFRKNGINFFVTSIPSQINSLSSLRKVPAVLRELNKIIQEFQPSLVHLHSLSMTPYIHLLRMRYQIPFVSTYHAEPSPSPKKAKIVKFTHRILPNLFGDRFIAISSELHQIFNQSLGVPEQRIKLIYHGVDSDYFRPPSPQERIAAREQFGLKENDRVVCLIGRLCPKKGHRVLIDAMANLEIRNCPVVALLAGKNYLDELEQIQEIVSHHNLDAAVHFLGMVDPRAVLWASDVLVLPSQTEAFPLVIIEAMLCGIPSIRTPTSGANDQIQDGVNGFIIPFENSNALAEKIEMILSDQNLQSILSSNSLSKAQNSFTAEIMCKNTLALYEELLLTASG